MVRYCWGRNTQAAIGIGTNTRAEPDARQVLAACR